MNGSRAKIEFTPDWGRPYYASEGEELMKFVAVIAVLCFSSVLAYAEGPLPCETLKAEIVKKLDANGSKGYTLDIVPKDKDADGKVVGSCEAGTKKIVYSKAAAAAKVPASAGKKP
jgi:hypothetical protein